MMTSRLSAAGGALALCLICVSFTAHAQSPDLAQVMAAMKALEARVMALEGENLNAKREAAEARTEARVLRQKLAGVTPAATPAPTLPRGALTPPVASQNPAAPLAAYAAVAPAFTWSGLYAGASFGVGALHASANNQFRNASTFSSTDVDPDVDGNGNPTLNIFTFNSTDSSLENDVLKSRRKAIGLADFYAGYNVAVANNFVIGAQAEGTLARGTVKLSGTGRSVDTSASTSVSTFGADPPTTTTSSSVGTSTFTTTDQLSLNWMATLLLRAGWADEQNLIYGVGGWAYGQFDNGGASFGMNGPTAGIGWERKLAPTWSLKGEYRYTKFMARTITDSSTSSSASSGPNTSGGTSSDVSANTDSSSNRYSADMHAVRVGVSHYFNAN